MHELFLKQITEHPRDMLPRLIYADWLEEQGDPRGEFIRLQIELYQLAHGPAPDYDRIRDLQTRGREFWQRHHRDWEAPVMSELPAYLHEVRLTGRYGAVLDWSYVRGFPEHFVGQGFFFLRYAELFARHFPLREAILTEMGQNLQQLARCPLAGRLQRLTVHATAELSLETAHQLVESPYLPAIEEFTLYLPDYSRDLYRSLSLVPGFRVHSTMNAPFVRRCPDLIEYL